MVKICAMPACLSLGGLSVPMTVEGAVDALVFLASVEQLLAPTLIKGDVVIMDNLGAHKVKGVAQAIEGRGAKVIYLPPDSPNLNPIEKCWSRSQDVCEGGKGAKPRGIREGTQRSFALGY